MTVFVLESMRGCVASNICVVNIVLCVSQPTYRKLLPLYYPRSEEEERASLPLIPADIGNSEGEPVVPERQIRIAEKPGCLEGKNTFPTTP